MLTVIQHPSELEGYSLVEENLIEQDPSFKYFLAKAEKGYREVLDAHPYLDYRPYQPFHAALFCVRRNNIMAHQQGCGKTSQSLLVVYSLLHPHKLTRRGCVHITVPNLLAAQRWVEELERFPSLKDMYSVITTEKDLAEAKQIIIYTHDFPKRVSKWRLDYESGSLVWRVGKKTSISRLLGKSYRPSLLIVDEIHELNSGTFRTSHLGYIRQRSRRCLALSGTLSDNKLDNLHHLCEFVYGKHWSFPDKETFTKRFGAKEKLSTNYLYGSLPTEQAPEKFLQKIDKNKLPEFYALMRQYIHRVRLDEPQIAAFIKLPEPNTVIHTLTPCAEQFSKVQEHLTEHKKVLQAIAQAQSKDPRHRAQALKLIMPLIEVANYPGYLTPKLAKVLELVKTGRKTVIFCNYVQSAWVVSEYLRQNLGRDKVVRLYAKDDNEDPKVLPTDLRLKVLYDFQYEPQVQAGVFSINLSNVAIDLTNADQIITYCAPWSSLKLQQMVRRVIRPGNRNNEVLLHYICQEGLIDEHQVTLAIEKLKGSSLLHDYEVETEADEADDLDPMAAIRRLLANA